MKTGKKAVSKNKYLHRPVVWKYVVSACIIAVYVLPIYVLVAMALKKTNDLSSLLAFPGYAYFDNFIKVFEAGKIGTALVNTVIITVCVLALEICVGGLASYPLARNKSRFNKFVQNLILGIMMIPSLSILVGVYSLLVKIGGISTLWGIIAVLAAFGLPMTIYLYTNFIQAIPASLDEASALDGCGVLQTFFHVILPQLKPVTVTVIILNGVSIWNEYAYSLYVLQKPKTYTLTLMISQYFSTGGKDFNGAAAAACIAICSLVVAYIFLQKYFIQGTIDSAVKG